MAYAFQVLFFLSPFLYRTIFRKDVAGTAVQRPIAAATILSASLLLFHSVNYFWYDKYVGISQVWIHAPLFLGFLFYAWVTRQNFKNLGLVLRFQREDFFLYVLSLLCIGMFFLILKVPLTKDV